MVNVARREDGLLDWANEQRERVVLALDQINLWELKGGLTVNEILILKSIREALEV